MSNRIPAAVARYMREFEETEPEFRKWLMVQKSAFESIGEPGTTLAGWLAFKMGCSVRAAESVIRWAALADNL